ncbi:MAG TPA: metal-dependent hydrolase [Candidatus Dojkabacteria bacterium]|nr:metal-dependent hydrolase [Candidatus Dojkabacteria bacterium]
MIIAHGPIAYIANQAIQKKKIDQLKTQERVIVSLFSLFFGILPDFDFFLALLLNVPTYQHHQMLTHYPIIYILLWIILKLLTRPIFNTLNKKNQNAISLNLLNIIVDTFLISTMSHMLTDTGIAFFYPLAKVKFGILQVFDTQNLFLPYVFSPMFALEILAIFIFIGLIYKKALKSNKAVNILLKSLTALSVALFVSMVIISQYTYNNSKMKGPDGSINYDIDYDRLIDSDDMDIGNDGKNNILKANSVDISDSALNIVNSHKWTANPKIHYSFGGFDAYRLVSQTYFDAHLPIEPVLNDYIVKNSEQKKYPSKKTDYITVLFNYLQSQDILIELNTDESVGLPYGKLLFIQEDSGKIINAGITLEGNNIAIVLPDDKVLQMHGYNVLLESYINENSHVYIQK